MHAEFTIITCVRARFIGVNCAVLPGSFFESELFGHEKEYVTGEVDWSDREANFPRRNLRGFTGGSTASFTRAAVTRV